MVVLMIEIIIKPCILNNVSVQLSVLNHIEYISDVSNMNASHLHPLTATKKTHYNRSNNPIKLLFYSKIVTLGVFLLVHWTSHISRKKINNEMSHIFDFIRALQISISLSFSIWNSCSWSLFGGKNQRNGDVALSGQ